MQCVELFTEFISVSHFTIKRDIEGLFTLRKAAEVNTEEILYASTFVNRNERKIVKLGQLTGPL
jgi:hypothetical protein